MYIVIHQGTGARDGPYSDEETAELARGRLQRDYPNLEWEVVEDHSWPPRGEHWAKPQLMAVLNRLSEKQKPNEE